MSLPFRPSFPEVPAVASLCSRLSSLIQGYVYSCSSCSQNHLHPRLTTKSCYLLLLPPPPRKSFQSTPSYPQTLLCLLSSIASPRKRYRHSLASIANTNSAVAATTTTTSSSSSQPPPALTSDAFPSNLLSSSSPPRSPSSSRRSKQSSAVKFHLASVSFFSNLLSGVERTPRVRSCARLSSWIPKWTRGAPNRALL